MLSVIERPRHYGSGVLSRAVRLAGAAAVTLGVLVGAGAGAAPAAADGAVVTRTDTTYFDLNTCSGDTVTLSGSGMVTMVQRQTLGGFMTKSTGQFTATDTSGNEYEATQTFSNISSGSDFEVTVRTLLVTTGSEPNKWFLVHLSFTDGIFTFSTELDCRG